tara:strand:- start:1306 stop:1692 length:387 start_codon:yes stop_codon:yes gene_type:complete
MVDEDDCIFCKIITGGIPSEKVYEDDNFIGILDINQVADGKTLLIPKKHYKTILDLPNSLGNEMLEAIKKISLKLIDEGKAEGINILVNTFKVAGQVVPHFHVHILPRKEGDGLKGLYLEEVENRKKK